MAYVKTFESFLNEAIKLPKPSEDFRSYKYTDEILDNRDYNFTSGGFKYVLRFTASAPPSPYNLSMDLYVKLKQGGKTVLSTELVDNPEVFELNDIIKQALDTTLKDMRSSGKEITGLKIEFTRGSKPRENRPDGRAREDKNTRAIIFGRAIKKTLDANGIKYSESSEVVGDKDVIRYEFNPTYKK
jgi:hypothetical protein